MSIREQYEKETGRPVVICRTDGVHCVIIEHISTSYVEWLESRVEGKGDGWISVKERLPDDAKSVLIFFDRHMSIGSHINDTWYCIDGTFHEVTHWMKPQPPAGQGD